MYGFRELEKNPTYDFDNKPKIIYNERHVKNNLTNKNQINSRAQHQSFLSTFSF